MMLLALLFSFQARAEAPLEIQVGRGVEAVELTCSGKTHRVDVRNGKAVFPVAPEQCQVHLVKRSGITKHNGTWFCNEGGCVLHEPPNTPVVFFKDKYRTQSS